MTNMQQRRQSHHVIVIITEFLSSAPVPLKIASLYNSDESWSSVAACFVYCKALWRNAGLGPNTEGSHVDLMSQQFTSSSVYVSVGAARHILRAVTIDLRLSVSPCLCVFCKSLAEIKEPVVLMDLDLFFSLFVRNKLVILMRLLMFYRHARFNWEIWYISRFWLLFLFCFF